MLSLPHALLQGVSHSAFQAGRPCCQRHKHSLTYTCCSSRLTAAGCHTGGPCLSSLEREPVPLHPTQHCRQPGRWSGDGAAPPARPQAGAPQPAQQVRTPAVAHSLCPPGCNSTSCTACGAVSRGFPARHLQRVVPLAPASHPWAGFHGSCGLAGVLVGQLASCFVQLPGSHGLAGVQGATR